MSLNYLKMVFLIGLIYMSFVGWSSNNWLMIWFIMEIVFLFFVGFVMVDINYGIIELMVKYFISQVFISLMFSGLVVVILFNLSYCLNLGLSLVLLMKLGMFPFHFWVIMILGKLNWLSFLLMTTVVKLLPILLVYYLNTLLVLNFMFMLSIVVGSMGGLGNTLIQKLLGYSSLVHLCWLLFGLEISVKVFLIYFFCYFFMMLTFVCLFELMGVYYINQFKLIAGSVYTKYLIFFLILSFAGFPPFLGFLLKWLISSLIFYFNSKVLIFLMIVFSLFSVLFYLELFYYFMMILGVSVVWYQFCFPGIIKFFSLIFVSYFFIYFFI